MQFERKTNTVRERDIQEGGINFRVGAGKPDRLSVTLNLSFRKKYGGLFFMCTPEHVHLP